MIDLYCHKHIEQIDRFGHDPNGINLLKHT